MKTLLFLLVSAFLLSSCDDQTSQPGSVDPYASWLSRGIHDYTIEQMNICYCVKGGMMMKLTVRADTVVQVMKLSDSTVLSPVDAKFYHSVKDMFDIIHNPGKDSLVVQYNSEFGYPEKLDINPQQHPYDGGVLIESSNLRVK
ncbi:MAG: DUF6174 domain-containing protein [Bacteroidota bacterium]